MLVAKVLLGWSNVTRYLVGYLDVRVELELVYVHIIVVTATSVSCQVESPLQEIIYS